MTDGKASERSCRCEAVIPAAILEGYACGAADCWRTAKAASSFAAFVDELKLKRDGAPDRDGGGDTVV